MTRSRTAMALAAATIGAALAYAPAAFADDMSHPMSKTDTMGKANDSSMKKDTMSHNGMSNDNMSHQNMSHDSMSKDGMKKDDMSK